MEKYQVQRQQLGSSNLSRGWSHTRSLPGPVRISASSGVPPAVVCTHFFLLSFLPFECAKTCAYKPGMERANMGSDSGPGTLVSGSPVLQQEGGLSQSHTSACVLLEFPASSLRVHRGHPHGIAVSGPVPWKVLQCSPLLHCTSISPQASGPDRTQENIEQGPHTAHQHCLTFCFSIACITF